MIKISDIHIETKTYEQAKRLFVKLYLMNDKFNINVRKYNGKFIAIEGFASKGTSREPAHFARAFCQKIQNIKNTGIKEMIIKTKKISYSKINVI